jgi:hypothetical protein
MVGSAIGGALWRIQASEPRYQMPGSSSHLSLSILLPLQQKMTRCDIKSLTKPGEGEGRPCPLRINNIIINIDLPVHYDL